MKKYLVLIAILISSQAMALEPSGSAGVSTDAGESTRNSNQSSVDRTKSMDLRKSNSSEQSSRNESRSSSSKSADRTEEITASTWLLNAMVAHGSNSLKICAKELSSLRAWKVDTSDMFNIPVESPSICAIAMNQISTKIVKKMSAQKTLPDSDNQAAAKLIKISESEIELAFNAAKAIIESNQISIDFGKSSGLAWQVGKYGFTTQNGAVSLLMNGRPFFDGDHINGKRITYRVASSSSSSFDKTNSAGNTSSQTADLIMSKKSSAQKSSETSRNTSSNNSISAGK